MPATRSRLSENSAKADVPAEVGTKKPLPKAPRKRALSQKINAAPVAQPSPVDAKAKVKTKKPKLVRDSFTFPKDEYELLAQLKSRATGLAVHVKKTELIRAGIKALVGMTDNRFLATVKSVPNLKTGRPAKA